MGGGVGDSRHSSIRVGMGGSVIGLVRQLAHTHTHTQTDKTIFTKYRNYACICAYCVLYYTYEQTIQQHHSD